MTCIDTDGKEITDLVKRLAQVMWINDCTRSPINTAENRVKEAMCDVSRTLGTLRFDDTNESICHLAELAQKLTQIELDLKPPRYHNANADIKAAVRETLGFAIVEYKPSEVDIRKTKPAKVAAE